MLATTCTASLVAALPAAAAEDTPLNEERCVALTQAISTASVDLREKQAQERAAQDAAARAAEGVAKAEENLATSANLVPNAERALEGARAELAALPQPGQSLEAAQQAVADAESRAEAARSALEASKAEAQKQFDRGSLGFFEAMGAQDAVAELSTDYRFKESDPITGAVNYRIADDTRIGAKDDATHLDNMKAAIAWLPEANRLRMSDGQPALPVTDFMMAQAQVNINWSQELPRGHSGNGWDNLAWNGQNPFDGWFHKERKQYFAAKAAGQDPYAAGAGHYMAIVNPDMVATGFAVNTETYQYEGYPWSIAYAQTFGVKWEQQGTKYTVDQYTQRFNNYYDGLKDAILNGDATKRNAVKQREAEVAHAKSALEAVQKVAAAKALVAQREQELEQAKSEQAAREQAAKEALAQAKQQQGRANQALAEAKAATAQAQATAERAESDYAPHKEACNKLLPQGDDGSSTGGIIAGVVLGLLAVVGIVVALNPQLLAFLQ